MIVVLVSSDRWSLGLLTLPLPPIAHEARGATTRSSLSAIGGVGTRGGGLTGVAGPATSLGGLSALGGLGKEGVELRLRARRFIVIVFIVQLEEELEVSDGELRPLLAVRSETDGVREAFAMLRRTYPWRTDWASAFFFS